MAGNQLLDFADIETLADARVWLELHRAGAERGLVHVLGRMFGAEKIGAIVAELDIVLVGKPGL